MPPKTFDTKYWAVIFTSTRTDTEHEEYQQMAERMEDLAKEQEGYLGIDSVKNEQGFGITVSYWKDQESIVKWKAHVDHKVAQKLGKEKWYKEYRLRICKVESEYDFSKKQ